jgi:3-phytase
MPTKFIAFLIMTAALLAGCEERPERVPPKGAVVTVVPTAETAVMPDADDAADDPAIWVHPSDPEQSLIIGTNKQRGLVIYRLDGSEASKRDDGRMNNVDLRQNVTVGQFTGDLVAATNRDKKSIDVYSLDGASATLTPVLSIPTGFADPYGLCLYRSAKTGELYVIANNSGDGMVGQWRVTADTLAFEAEQVRNFSVGSQAEGCAADDENGVLFIAEEDVGLYAYWAEPDEAAKNKNARLVIDSTTGTGHLTADAEGVAIIKTADGGGYVIVSSQGSNSYNLYDRIAPHAFRGAFQIGPTSEQEGIDGVEETDGIDVTAAPLGGAYAEGLFVAQDGFNYNGAQEGRRANQNFKLVPWQKIREALALPEPVTPADAEPEPLAKPN